MLEEIAQIASEKAEEIAIQEVHKFTMDNIGVDVDEETKKLVVERAISQMTFHLNGMHNLAEDDLADQFEKWFSGAEEDALRKSCYRCVKEEVEKRKSDEDPNMSFLDRYLKEHKRHLKNS